MLFLDGAYVERSDGSARFRWLKAPRSAELTPLACILARRVSRFLERQGLLERDAENSYLSGETVEAGPMNQLAAQGTELQAGAIAIDRGWAPIQWKTNIRLFPLSKHLAGHDASIDVDQAEEQDL